MTAISSTKSLKASVASALVLGAFAATPAFAQLTTSGSYIPLGTDSGTVAHPVVSAPGNSLTFSAFQAAITAAFTAGTGGDVTFDNLNATAGDPAFGNFGQSYSQTPGTPISAAYGTGASKSITFTDGVALNPNNSGVGVVGAPYSFNNNQAAAQGTTSGTVYLGSSGGTTPIVFNFSQNLSNFGIVVIDRNAARGVIFSVTLSNGSTVNVSGTTAVPTSTDAIGPMFFNYQAAAGTSIASASMSSPDGFIRMDDLGFVTAAAPAATPEPSQVAGLGLGVMGLGLLALKARKRTALGS